MQKFIFVLFQKSHLENLYPFTTNTLSITQGLIADLKVSRFQLNDISGAIEKGSHHRQVNHSFQPIGVLTLWFESLNKVDLKKLISNLQKVFDDVWYFEVDEKVVLNNLPIDGENSFTQYALISKHSNMSKTAFFDHWQDVHTEIAINTQSTFSYIQNTITQDFSQNHAPFLAIVEESFPIAALEDPAIFYNADSKEVLEKNIARMMESCQKFLNFEEIIVFPTKQLNLM